MTSITKKKVTITTKITKYDNYKYNEMNDNECANILQEPNEFQVPHNTDEHQDFFLRNQKTILTNNYSKMGPCRFRKIIPLNRGNSVHHSIKCSSTENL